MTLTRQQREALRRVYERRRHDEVTSGRYMAATTYRAFRRTVQPGPGCIMVRYAGMWLGIEPDGYTHS